MTNSMHLLKLSLAAAAFFLPAAVAPAGDLAETTAGDFSGTAALPTPWTLGVGANLLSGRAGRDRAVVDYDLVVFTVPAGSQLNSINATSYQNADVFAIAFLALEAGPAWTDALGGGIQGGAMMGWVHLESSMTGANLLPEMQDHATTDPPFAVPLTPGVYTMLIQDIDTMFDYGLTFNVSTVPEPGSAALATMGMVAVALRRARRR